MLSRQSLDRNHPAAVADGAFPQRVARESLVSIPIVLHFHRNKGTFTWRSHVEKLAAPLQFLRAVAVAEETIVANAVEPTRQNMK
jgi:hypothetical protein